MARFDNHGENFRDFVLVVSSKVTEQVRVELQKLNLVAADHSGNKSQHEELNFILIIALLELRKQAFDESLCIVNGVDWQKVGIKLDQALSGLLTFNQFDCSVELLLSIFCHFRSLSLLKKRNLITHAVATIITGLVVIRFKVIIQNQEKLTRRNHNFWVAVQAGLGNDVYGFLVVPDLTLVKFNHDIQGSSGRSFILILNHREDEILQLFVDVVNFVVEVQFFQVRNQNGV